METVAVYWEPKIKTYGFYDVSDLSLLELGFQYGRLSEWSLGLYEMEDLGISLELVSVQYEGEKGLRVYVLFQRRWEERLLHHVDKVIRKDEKVLLDLTSPVELLFFFGPHFGDRYGIVDSVFKVLTHNDITVLATACSGSAVYLVLPEGMAYKTKALLGELFEIP